MRIRRLSVTTINLLSWILKGNLPPPLHDHWVLILNFIKKVGVVQNFPFSRCQPHFFQTAFLIIKLHMHTFYRRKVGGGCPTTVHNYRVHRTGHAQSIYLNYRAVGVPSDIWPLTVGVVIVSKFLVLLGDYHKLQGVGERSKFTWITWSRWLALLQYRVDGDNFVYESKHIWPCLSHMMPHISFVCEMATVGLNPLSGYHHLLICCTIVCAVPCVCACVCATVCTVHLPTTV